MMNCLQNVHSSARKLICHESQQGMFKVLHSLRLDYADYSNLLSAVLYSRR